MSHAPAAVELVVLLDESGHEIGTMPKSEVHTAHTPLHRAFSCYVFGPHGQVLLTQRALDKSTFPGVWTNTVCGHPAPGEDDVDAIRRRAEHELGITVTDIRPALPDFRYRAEFQGVVENEICPVYLARTGDTPQPRPDEVNDWVWLSWEELPSEVARRAAEFSAWSQTQISQLRQRAVVRDYLQD
ncbi:isopentenyl-diphosphate Delta-isomerase [Rhodococcus sp. X156]|uniref:isopentenyl-diphosphate Delta-isomerase n=1 Tax=Rhodococcus sp. X156 TaxID=2499145 RepID=UPI000FDC3D7E|nr:isopentenyl-diphosphate Delta-isomerase [Rhodococcus sp. X156]